MKNRILSALLFISICAAFLPAGVIPAACASGTIVYYEDFEDTAVGELPDNFTLNIAAPFGESGYLYVANTMAVGSKALESRHQVTASGTNFARLDLPMSVMGNFALDVDLLFGDVMIEKELAIYTPSGSILFAIGLQRSGAAYIGNGRRLYYKLGSGEATELSEFNFDISAEQKCHFNFEADMNRLTLLVTMDSLEPISFDLTQTGILEDAIGIGAVRMSTRYSGAVGGTNRYFAIDNIQVMDKNPEITNFKPDIYKLLPDVYLSVGGTAETDLTVYFYDPEDEALSFTADIGLIDQDGVWKYTADEIGIFPATVTAEDPEGLTFSDTFNIIVNDTTGKNNLIYYEDFETTPPGKVPPNVDLTIAAPFTGGGGVYVINDGDSYVLRNNHRVGGSGTNHATLNIPWPGYGDFVMETDIRFGDNVTRKEFGIYNPEGSPMMIVGLGLGSSMNNATPEALANSRKLYTTIGGIKMLMDDFEPVYTRPYHFKFEFDSISAIMNMTIDGGEPIPLSLEETGIDPQKLGIGSIRLSSYFNNAVNADRFIQLDNITVRADFEVSEDDIDIVKRDADEFIWEYISAENIDSVTKSLNLRTRGTYGSVISWSSSNESVLSSSGMVLPQGETKTVTLIATFKKATATAQKIFRVTVLPKEQSVYGDWFFEDFESFTAGESIIGKPGWTESITPPINNDTDMTCVIDPANAGNQVLKGNCNHTGIQNYSGYSGLYDFPEIFGGDFELSFDFRVGQLDTESTVTVFNSSNEEIFGVGVSAAGAFSHKTDGKSTSIGGMKPSANMWYKFKLLVSASDRYVAWYVNDTLLATFRQTENVAQNYNVGRMRFYMWVKKTGVGSMYIDNLRIREDITAKLARAFDKIYFNGLSDGVEDDFPIPTATSDGTPISWSSDNSAIVIDGGTARVTRLAPGESDVDVVITATASMGGATITRDYIIKVLRQYTDEEAIVKDADGLLWSMLSAEPRDAVTSAITLPKAGRQGTAITWTVSGDALTLTAEGAAPAPGISDSFLTLTATIGKGSATVDKIFDLVILRKLPVNLAENRKAIGHSTQIASKPVTYAFDGNFQTDWSTLYADNAPYVIIDLGVKQPVDSFMLSERSKNIKSIKVSWSNDNLSYKAIFSFNKTTYPDKTETDIHSFSVVEARYFKVETERLRTEEEVLINEIQFYNSKLTDTQSVNFASQIFDIYGKDSITGDIILPQKGSHGTTLTYQSSNGSIIASDGKVTRPADTTKVNLTVTFKKGSESVSRVIVITVIGSNSLVVPNTTDYKSFDSVFTPMSDEAFFGVWNSAKNVWDINSLGVFDYNINPEMQRVGEYVKKGDYDTAKSALVLYYKTRDIGYKTVQSSRDYTMADLYINNIVNSTHPFITSANVPSDWGEVTADVSSLIKKPGKYSMFIMQKYKHEAEAEFYSKEAGERSAALEIEYSGKVKTYPVIADTYVSPDTNINNNYGSETRLYVKETAAANPNDAIGGYGNLWTADTKRAYLRFNINDLDENTVITNATLKIYGRAPGGAEVLLWKEGLTDWNENTFNWVETLNDVYSWNGGKVDWVYPTNKADGGVEGQIPRFYWGATICGAYGSSGDEYYAYHSIRQIIDFIEGTKDYIGYGNLQATGIRAGGMVISFNQLLKSKHFTDAAAITMIQYLWQMTQTLSQDSYFRQDHNHGIYANRGLMRLTMYFGEFSKHTEWKKLFIERYNLLLNTLVYADGAYREATTNYTAEVAGNLLTAIEEAKAANFSFDPLFVKKTRDLTMFLAHLLSPTGADPAYGDSEHNLNHKARVQNIAEALGDEKIKYMYTNGAEGEYPGFTSKLYPQGRYLVMRDGYDKDAWMMHTNWGIGDGRSHTHPDNMSLTMHAYGKYLVADPGRFNYTDNEYSNWIRYTTQAHNVVNINQINQGLSADTMDLFVTNDGFDYFTGTSKATKDFDAKPFNYQRSVLFSKSKFFVVSDKVTPDASNYDINTYDQNWHFLPDSNISYTASTGMMRTNFERGSQLIIAQADKETVSYTPVKKYFSVVNQEVSEAEYAQFTQEKAGGVSFDTVLYPVPAGDKTKARADRITLDVPKQTATALDITVDDTINVYKNTYYMTYETTPSLRTVGNLTYDGKAMLVEYAASGQIDSISMVDGKELTSDGKVVVRAKNKVADIFIYYNWDEISIQSSSLTDNAIAGLEILSEKKINKVTLNGKSVAFYQNGNAITVGSLVSQGNNSVSVTPQGNQKVGTTVADYENVLSYVHKNKQNTITLSIAGQTTISGASNWDGTMPKLQTGTTAKTVNGDIVQVIVFDNKNLTFAAPYSVKIYKASDIQLYQSSYKKLPDESMSTAKNNLTSGEVGIYSGNGYITLFSYTPIEVILYKAYEVPPTPPSVPAGGGGGGGGAPGGEIISPIVPEPDEADTNNPDTGNNNTNSSAFNDIEGHWAKVDIEFMASIGIAKGDNGNFNPDNNITRAEFTAFTVRMLGYEKEEYSEIFYDVSNNDWFAGDVLTAYKHGLIAGYDNQFRPNELITREETAVILAKLIATETTTEALAPYADKDDVSDWAETAMAAVIQGGIISGVDQATLAPKAFTTRAMAITMLARMYKVTN